MLLAVATTSAVLILTLLPSTASAASGASPAESHPSGGPTAAVAGEFNQAVAGSPPSGLPCIATTGAIACYQEYGDRWWVKDTALDSASAEAVWENYRNGRLYRSGICRNSLGNGNWGVCNKNYYEDSTIWWRACVYNGIHRHCSGLAPPYSP
jgi:hypothetical protein